MKRLLMILFAAVIVFSAVLPVMADRETIWPSVGNSSASQDTADNTSSANSGSLWSSDKSKKPVISESTSETTVQTVSSSEEEPIWSNFNNDPVMNHPKYYKKLTVKEDEAPVLVQRIRTYHWNNGNGAQPGTISVYEGDTKLGSWQAVGRSAYGVANVYWDVLVDIIMYPGHSYTIKVSDIDSMSHNEASGNCGMFEVYGQWPAPLGYVASTQSSSDPVSVPLTVGSTFKMGRYEQDNNIDNGPESIDWQVLAVQNDRMLVISKYALDFRAYNDVVTNITWEYSSLRNWLNNDFYNTAFNSTEKNQILLVTNENPDNPQYGTDGGSRTQDRIFVLSYDEAQRYFKSDEARICKVTDYAAAKYESAYSSVTSYYQQRSSTFMEASWWLRTPGENSVKTVYVTVVGSIYFYGFAPMTAINGTAYNDVRPAFWMKAPASPKPTPTPAPRNCFTVKYSGNNCLAQVPTDNRCYKAGDTVTVLFEPVEYMQSMIFNGWDRDGDGVADHGYYYNTFTMPAKDVELNAICYRQQYKDNYNNQYYGVTTGEVDPGYHFDQGQYYNPYNNPNLNNDIYDPGTGWWFDPGSYYEFYDGVG